MKEAIIICLVCFGILTIKYFVDWMNEKAEANHWLGWFCALSWCIIAAIMGQVF
jgi:hypothetical protein